MPDGFPVTVVASGGLPVTVVGGSTGGSAPDVGGYLGALAPQSAGARAIQKNSRTFVDLAFAPANAQFFGNSPLSGAFSTLADARSFFGKMPDGTTEIVTALTQQVAACSIQKAIVAAKAAGGGVVYSPAGLGTRYMGSQKIVMPDSPAGDDSNDAVHWRGDGQRNTVVYWHQDSAAAQDAVGLKTRHAYSRVVLSDMTLLGPSPGFAIGATTKPCNLAGIAMASGWTVERITGSNFCWPQSIVDDHTTSIDCIFGRGCLYSCYWDVQVQGVNDLGDHHFRRCNYAFASLAAHGIAPTNQVENSLFIDCHMGWSPFVFWRESGATFFNAITNTRFIKTQAEAVGNGFFGCADGTTNTFDRINKCVFENIQFLQDAAYRKPGVDVAFIKAGELANCRFVGPHAQFGSPSLEQCTSSFLQLAYFKFCHFEGPTADLFGYLSAAHPICQGAETFRVTFKTEFCEGVICQLGGSGATLAKGNVASTFADQAMRMDHYVAQPRFAAGVALHAATEGQCVPLVTGGIADVTKSPGAIRQDYLVYLDPAAAGRDSVVQGTSLLTATSIGTARGAASAGDATVSVVVSIRAVVGTGATGPLPYLGQVATRGRYSEGKFANPNNLIRSRVFHRARARITDGTRFRYDNFYGPGETGSGGNLVIGRVDIEYPIGSGAFYPLDFSGSASATVANQASAFGTLSGVTVPDGAPFNEWVVATFTAGALYANTTPLVDIAQVGSSFGSTTPGTTTGMSGAQQVYGATAILGPTTKPSVLLLGDSRLSGGGALPGSNDMGQLAKAIGTRCGYINLGTSGANMYQFRDSSTARLTGLAAYCTHVVYAGLINDITGGSNTTTLKQIVEQTITKFGGGKINAICTVEPQTTGAWSAADGSDQTVWDATKNGYRVAHNNAARSGTIAGAHFVFDLADAVESSRDSGKWLAGHTDDGLHANVKGQMRYLNFVNPALLGDVAYVG